MADTIYSTATEYRRNQVTMTVGSPADITAQGVYFTPNAAAKPAVADFTAVQLVDGTKSPPDALSEAGKVDLLYRVGARAGADFTLTPGDYQRWTLVSTADEDIITAVDVLTVL